MPVRVVIVAFALFASSCASGGIVGPSRDAGNGGSDIRRPTDTRGEDVAVDLGNADTPVTDTDPADSGDPDVDPMDIGMDTGPQDTGMDVTPDVPSDTGRDPDTGPGCVGVGCACTTGNAAQVCQGAPCVDGYCCDTLCDATCVACDIAGSEGSCAPVPVGTDPDNECLTDSAGTCGRTGECDGAGACAYYSDTTPCNDGQSCSTGDACDGAGMCRGVVPDNCGPGAGNECCVGTCVDGAGCQTEASACGDTCGSSELTIGDTCAGCGAPGAVGVCSGGATYLCDETNHNPCQELACGGVTYWCTQEGGTWAWRPSSVCDDGDACTYNDRCLMGSCGGTVVDCTDSECMDRSCNGTATCQETPRTGETCNDGDLCTFNDVCSPAESAKAGERSRARTRPASIGSVQAAERVRRRSSPARPVTTVTSAPMMTPVRRTECARLVAP